MKGVVLLNIIVERFRFFDRRKHFESIFGRRIEHSAQLESHMSAYTMAGVRYEKIQRLNTVFL